MSRIRRGREATNIDTMMERLGIDVGSRAAPRFGLLFSCTLRNCSCCTAYESCSRWLATKHEPLVGPPKFCPNFDLLSELFFDPTPAMRARVPATFLVGGAGKVGWSVYCTFKGMLVSFDARVWLHNLAGNESFPCRMSLRRWKDPRGLPSDHLRFAVHEGPEDISPACSRRSR